MDGSNRPHRLLVLIALSLILSVSGEGIEAAEMIVCRLSCIRETGFASVRRPSGRQPLLLGFTFGPVGFTVDEVFQVWVVVKSELRCWCVVNVVFSWSRRLLSCSQSSNLLLYYKMDSCDVSDSSLALDDGDLFLWRDMMSRILRNDRLHMRRYRSRHC